MRSFTDHSASVIIYYRKVSRLYFWVNSFSSYSGYSLFIFAYIVVRICSH